MQSQTQPQGPAPVPERFRGYLLTLARLHLGEPRRGDPDPSDLVQEVLLEAHPKLGQFRGHTEAEMAGWLRRMLACGLIDARRAARRARRDVARERFLEADLDRSSTQLGGWLVADQTSPSSNAARHERAIAVAEALARLPEAQRRALVLRHYENRSLAEISEQMGRTPAAVAGLLKRGSRQLHVLLRERG
jgi:RNA polymerase sigma-70 factor (ECF subfamily)